LQFLKGTVKSAVGIGSLLLDGIGEVQRKFFGTLYNTYSFFALYANVDGFTYSEAEIPMEKRCCIWQLKNKMRICDLMIKRFGSLPANVL